MLDHVMRFKSVFYILLSILIAAVTGVILYEIYYRYELKKRIESHFAQAFFWIQNKSLIDTDENGPDTLFGYHVSTHPRGLFRIKDNIDISVIPVDQVRGTLNFSVRTNNIGVLSDYDYEFERNPQKPEYRIVVLGDSMTGPTTSTYQWVDTVQELLNQSQELRHKIGDKVVKVYNLGWVGAGFGTFANAFDKSGQYFDPDLVVINYIEIDFPRTVGGVHMTDDAQMIKHAAYNIQRVVRNNKNILLSVMPVYAELIDRDLKFKKSEQLKEMLPEARIADMREFMLNTSDKLEVDSWFNLPHDAHYSDRGGEVYARALAGYIVKELTGRKEDFFRYKTRYSELVLGLGKPKTRVIQNATSRMTSNQVVLKKMSDDIIKKIVSSRVYRIKPWVFEQIQRTGVDGIAIPYSKKLDIAMYPIRFDSGDNDVAYLGLACTNKPYDLNNPNCYTHLHMFIKDIDNLSCNEIN